MPPRRSPYMTKEISALAGDQRRSQLQEKALADLLAIHDRFLTAIEDHKMSVDEVKQYAQNIQDHAERIQNLPPGEKGDSIQGDPGESVDFEQVVASVLERMPEVKHGISPDPDLIATRVITRLKEGKKDKKGESVVDIPAIIDAVIGHLKDKKVLTKEHIGGLDAEISSYRHQMAMRQAGQHGGGDTLQAGAGQTLTRNNNGTVTLTVPTGSVTPLTPVGAVNGSNTSYTVASEPTSVIADGVTYFAGAGYTYLALTITMDTAPSQYIRYYA